MIFATYAPCPVCFILNPCPVCEPNEYGERKGDICCQRSTSGLCFEHDAANYPINTGAE
jgi:hypothetical protein